MSDLVIHLEALNYPLLSDAELASMAEDIAANGQRDPIVLDQDGRLIDGRNRLEACRRAEVEPTFTTIEFADEEAIADYILSVNVEKRSLTSGQKAMYRAENYARQGKRVNGRWQRGSVLTGDITESRNTYKDAMNKAGLIIDVAKRAEALNDPNFAAHAKLPADVKADAITLDGAYKIAQQYESAAQMAELSVRLPFAKAAGLLEQLASDAKNDSAVIPFIELPLTKEDRTQLNDIAKAFKAAAKNVESYLEETQQREKEMHK